MSHWSAPLQWHSIFVGQQDMSATGELVNLCARRGKSSLAGSIKAASPLTYRPHPEERREAARLEGWATDTVLVPTLRDASRSFTPRYSRGDALRVRPVFEWSTRIRSCPECSNGLLPIRLRSSLADAEVKTSCVRQVQQKGDVDEVGARVARSPRNRAAPPAPAAIRRPI